MLSLDFRLFADELLFASLPLRRLPPSATSMIAMDEWPKSWPWWSCTTVADTSNPAETRAPVNRLAWAMGQALIRRRSFWPQNMNGGKVHTWLAGVIRILISLVGFAGLLFQKTLQWYEKSRNYSDGLVYN